MTSSIKRSLANEMETVALGRQIGRLLHRGDCVALEGALGCGKTTLVRGVMREISAEREIPSPSFTIVQSYQTEALPLWHVDLYRIASPDEILELGLEEAEEGALFLEWPERMGRALPAARLHIRFTIEKDERRDVLITAWSKDWAERLGLLDPSLRKTP